MKNLLSLVALTLLTLTATQASACDEQCKRERAMAQHNVDFPSYLTAKFCETTSVDFLLRDYQSFAKYRNNRLMTGHKGGLNNIRKMLDQRKEWLIECDDYLRLTEQGRIFYDAQTTKTIFAAMDKLSEQLNSLVYNGSKNVIVTNGLDVAEQDFDNLLGLLDQHKTDLQLRGKLIIR